MADITAPPVPAAAGFKIAQLVTLVKDNQLIALSQGVTALGGVC